MTTTPRTTTINPRSRPTIQRPEETPISKKELQKLLVNMMIKLANILATLSGDSLNIIKDSVINGKKYNSLLKILQNQLNTKLKEINKVIKTQEVKQTTQKTLSWVSLFLGVGLAIIGVFTCVATVGVGVGAGGAAISIGVSLAIGATLEVTGAIDAMDKAIDKAYGEDNKEAAAGAKIGAKVGIMVLISILTAGAGAAGTAANAAKLAAKSAKTIAKAAKISAEAAKKAAKAIQAGKKAVKATKAAKLGSAAKTVGKEMAFTSLYYAAAFNVTQDVLTLAKTKASPEAMIAINAVLTVLAIIIGFTAAARGRGGALTKTAAATTIQKAFRTSKAAKQTKAATTIQRAFRTTRATTGQAKAATTIQRAFRTSKAAKSAKGSKPTSTPAPYTSPTKSTGWLSKKLKSLKSLNKAKVQKWLTEDGGGSKIFEMILLLGSLGTGAGSSVLSIQIGQLDFVIGNMLRELGGVKSTSKLVERMLDANKDFITVVTEFMNQIQELVRTSAENPSALIADEIEFARVYGQSA